MAAGDTIAGTLRVLREKQDGGTVVMVSGLNSARCDEDVAGNVYFNMAGAKATVAAAGDQHFVMLKKWFEGEKIVVQLSASALAEAVAYDTAGSQNIGIIRTDLNTKEKWADVLLNANQELTADPTSVVGTYVTIFEETVPAQQTIQLAGLFHCIGPENA
ncbi:MAG: hypothetical protein ACYTEQ_19455 [Planctomycetota bacterium]|jgi:hypothetical protein